VREFYLKKAEENLPEIYEEIINSDSPEVILDNGDIKVIDLGNHYVGYFSFRLLCADMFIDAPVRLKIRFLETKEELEYDFSEYKGGLCKSWLQEEIINIDYPGEYKLPRRFAARYIEIKVVAASRKIKLSDFKFTAVTSADKSKLAPVKIKDEELLKIDTVAVNTLKNCMQRFFEDGPKRDRRLWIGDLRLEAMANYPTFNNLSLVRRCLYLFAAADTNDKGFIPGYVYDYPEFVSGYWHLTDYALLFTVTACDYFAATDDKETFSDLLPVIKGQLEAMHNTLDADGIVTVPEGCEAFIDWCKGLEKITSMHGVYLYALRSFCNALEKPGDSEKSIYEERYRNALKSAEEILYNKEKNTFENIKDNYQLSVHSAVWMILGGVVEGKKGEELLLNALNSEASVKPFTPYMQHYVAEAMVKLNLLEEAKKYIKSYWGGMVKRGTDTFYEAYVPEDPDFSPYGDKMMNSMCHAWSCTPSYFIRKYFF